MGEAAEKVAQTNGAIDFRTEPTRYRHWKLAVEGETATLTMDVDEKGGLLGGYELGLAERPGKTGTGGGQRLEAEMLQGAGAAGIEGIGDDEAPALVQFLECGAFVSRCQHGSLPSIFVGAADIVAPRPFRQTPHGTTLRRNVRSSARINLCSSAKLKLAMPSPSARSRAR